jgi:alpha-tubulin suppressor-like RCC1 family protein
MCYRGDFGRLGHGDCGDVFLPRPIAVLSDKRIVACSCGDTHTLCVTSEGQLFSFGRNSNGQLGNGRTDDNTTPAIVEALQVHIVSSVMQAVLLESKQLCTACCHSSCTCAAL